MEIKEHLYFRSQKVTISGVLNYIIRSNSLYTYITSNSFNKSNTGDPLKKKKMAGALEEKAVETERDKMAGALEEKEEKREDKGERNNEKKRGKRRKRWEQKKRENEELEAKGEPTPILETHSLAKS